jgi:hypothetical protein
VNSLRAHVERHQGKDEPGGPPPKGIAMPSSTQFDKRVTLGSVSRLSSMSSRSRCDQGATKAGTTSASLPLALGRRQFCLDHSDQRAAGLVECLRQLEDCGERGLLLTQFEDAHVSATQVGLKAKLLLRQTRFQAQLTKNFPESDRWLQTFLLLLEELGRKDMIMSSHSCRNHIWFDSPTERSEWK